MYNQKSVCHTKKYNKHSVPNLKDLFHPSSTFPLPKRNLWQRGYCQKDTRRQEVYKLLYLFLLKIFSSIQKFLYSIPSKRSTNPDYLSVLTSSKPGVYPNYSDRQVCVRYVWGVFQSLCFPSPGVNDDTRYELVFVLTSRVVCQMVLRT